MIGNDEMQKTMDSLIEGYKEEQEKVNKLMEQYERRISEMRFNNKLTVYTLTTFIVTNIIIIVNMLL